MNVTVENDDDDISSGTSYVIIVDKNNAKDNNNVNKCLFYFTLDACWPVECRQQRWRRLQVVSQT